MAYLMEKDGIVAAVMMRFLDQRLPRIMHIKECVDKGGKLNEHDISFLMVVLEDTRQYTHFVSTHDEYKKLYVSAIKIYQEIISKALENKQK